MLIFDTPSETRRPFRRRPPPRVHSLAPPPGAARQPLPTLHLLLVPWTVRPHPRVHGVPASGARQPVPGSHFRRPFRTRPHLRVHGVPPLAARQSCDLHCGRPRFRLVHPGTLHCRYCLDSGIESRARAGPGGFGIFGISSTSPRALPLNDRGEKLTRKRGG